MNILGISAFYHDSAACLVQDGKIIAAAQEERFTRKKHDPGFPKQAIEFCLKQGKITTEKIDYVVFYEKPFIKFDRLLETYLQFAPSGYPSYIKAIPSWVKKKLWMKDTIRTELQYKGKMLFPEHHESHAASAFYPSPFKEAAILTLDGVGEWATTTMGIGKGNSMEIVEEIAFPHSLGLLYSALTYYLGFTVNSGEYKVMGLASYGTPKYIDRFYNELIDVKDDGSFHLNMKYFNYAVGLTMTNDAFNTLMGGPVRRKEDVLTQRHMDIARSLQYVTEDIILKLAQSIYKKTKMKNLCLAGGVALNCVANGRLLQEGPFDDIWIQPAAGDAGGALGGALFAWYKYLGNPRTVNKYDSMQGALLGPEYSNQEIEQFLIKKNIPYKKASPKELVKIVATNLKNEQVIGWVQGRMEFGPRALGNRSILGDPRSPRMQKTMNLKIKFRESFRPFAPAILEEKVNTYFDLDHESPYMLLVAPVKKTHRKKLSVSQEKKEGLERLSLIRSDIPAVTHVDYSARIQTISKRTNPLYYELISEFYKQTKCPLIINTSFNVRGEPIVKDYEDAYRCFMRTNIDFLILGNYILEKKKQPSFDDDKKWKQEFVLD